MVTRSAFSRSLLITRCPVDRYDVGVGEASSDELFVSDGLGRVDKLLHFHSLIPPVQSFISFTRQARGKSSTWTRRRRRGCRWSARRSSWPGRILIRSSWSSPRRPPPLRLAAGKEPGLDPRRRRRLSPPWRGSGRPSSSCRPLWRRICRRAPRTPGEHGLQAGGVDLAARSERFPAYRPARCSRAARALPPLISITAIAAPSSISCMPSAGSLQRAGYGPGDLASWSGRGRRRQSGRRCRSAPARLPSRRRRRFSAFRIVRLCSLLTPPRRTRRPPDINARL